MIVYPEAPRAWGYTRGMARTMGVSLPEAVLEGWISRGDLDHLVEACRTCGETGKCTEWLAQTVETEAAPGFCRNAPVLGALKS
jgi:hypothetical protein